jgi:formylglycine-generating enzyme required for sulfatase activity
MLRAVIALLVLLVPSVAQAEARIALLIGNQGYSATVGTLKNPFNDIAVVGDALSRQGFEVLPPIKDAKRSAILAGVRDLVRRLNVAGAGAVGFIYYSGHGAAEKDTNINYLIPVDASAPGTSAFWDDSVKLDDVLRLLDGARSAAKFIVFDACRTELRLPTKDTSKGLLPVAEQQGMFIAYASAPGQTASDIGDYAGPYAAALATELGRPGLDHLALFQNVKEAVYAASGGAQQPWESNGLVRRVYLTGAAPGSPGKFDASAAAERAWMTSRESSDPAVLEAFISRFKESLYADLARSRLSQLKDARVAMAAPSAPPSPARPSASCDGLEITVGQSERRCFKPGAGKTEHFQDCPTCPEMVVVPPGHFTMGSPESEPERDWNKDTESPQHEVTVGAAFAVGRFAVTRREYATFVRETNLVLGDKCWVFEGDKWEVRVGRSFRNPGFAQDDRHPAVCVSWEDAKAFAAWFSRKTGKLYRLLTEAEREYVTRAGTSTPFWWGTSVTPKQANYNGKITYAGGGSKGEYRKRTMPVDSFEPNPWGLYQVHGNVSEWTEDCRHENYQGAPTDGSAWTTACFDSSSRAARGSSWLSYPRYFRSAARDSAPANYRGYGRGFRLARTLSP